MKTYIIANWKMHLSPRQAAFLTDQLKKEIGRVPSDVQVVLCPPMLDLLAVQAELGASTKLELGVQNVYPMDEGAFTGETSVAMVKDIAKYVLVGHSERRHVFHERDSLLAQKMSATLRHGLTPVFCVGETKREKDDGHAKRVVSDQLEAGLSLLTEEELTDIIIAYEPVWAIGTGDNAKPKDADAMFVHIRSWLHTKYNEATSKAIPILYGGSVNDKDAGSFLKLPDCNGVLVGGASLKADSFAAIVAAA